jgi:hypothetical protein
MTEVVNLCSTHSRFAGRRAAGTEYPITVSKNGVYHHQIMPDGTERDIIACGLACSECFSSKNLYNILKPGFDLEQKVMQDLAQGKPAEPLSIHTSSGVVDALGPFIEALSLHLPWKDKDTDWCVSLQLEGASAVFAAIDMVLQVNMIDNPEQTNRIKVAVGATSYHGPPSTSWGAKSPIWYVECNQIGMLTSRLELTTNYYLDQKRSCQVQGRAIDLSSPNRIWIVRRNRVACQVHGVLGQARARDWCDFVGTAVGVVAGCFALAGAFVEDIRAHGQGKGHQGDLR